MSLSPIAVRAARHLPGKHDQKSHGRKGGGGSGLPAGWEVTADDPYLYSVTKGSGLVVIVPAFESPGLVGVKDDGARSALMHDMVNRTAQVLDPLDRAYPSAKKLTVEIVPAGELRARIGSTWRETPGGLTLFGGSTVLINQSLFYTPKVGPGSFNPWRGDVITKDDTSVELLKKDVPGGAQGVSYEAWAYGKEAGPGKFHGQNYRADPVRAVITHEYGHVVDSRATQGLYDPVAHMYVQTSGPALLRLGRPEYDSLPGYAKTSATEMYAEAFSEWGMRDVATPSEGAAGLASLANWEGASG